MGLVQDIAQTTLEQGRIQGEGAARAGQIWGTTIANLGQLPNQIRQQQQQDQELDLRKQALQLQVQGQQNQMAQQQRQQAAEDALNNAYSKALKPDGSVDSNVLAQGLAGTPAASHWPTIQAGLASAQEKSAQVTKLRGEIDSAERDHIAALSNAADTAPDPQAKAGVLLAGLASGVKNGSIDPDHAKSIIAQILGPDGQPDPEAVTRKIAQMKQLSAVDVEKRAQAAKDMAEAGKAGTGGSVTETGLALRAAQGDPIAAAALDRLKPQKSATETAAEMDSAAQNLMAKRNRGEKLNANETADLKAYEERKLLGPEAAAAAAGNRQAATIAAQVAQQGRAQNFNEQQAGRAELTNKVEQPYLDAKEKAATLRSVIDAAKNGNMAAANVQSLLATLGLVTMEGVKRINTTELQQVGGAGSLLERVKGEIGGIVTGKPLSAKIQQDLGDLSNMLESSARQKYLEGHKAVTKRYQLTDEPPLPDASGAPAADPLVVNGFRFPTAAAAAAARKAAGLQ